MVGHAFNFSFISFYIFQTFKSCYYFKNMKNLQYINHSITLLSCSAIFMNNLDNDPNILFPAYYFKRCHFIIDCWYIKNKHITGCGVYFPVPSICDKEILIKPAFRKATTTSFTILSRINALVSLMVIPHF
jgi:hypothetical protein